MTMTTGTLTAEAEEAGALQHDVLCILMRFHRQQGLQSLRFDATQEDLKADAARLSVELGAAIGGRYVPKRDLRAETLAARNQAIYAMWNGTNRIEVMRHFGISRRLFYMVIAQETRRRHKLPRK
jgi:Mor family transcriptional regulator